MNIITMNKKEQLLTGIYFLFQQLLLTPILLSLPLPLTLAQLEFVYFVTNFLLTLLICRKFLWQNIRYFSKNFVPTVFAGLVVYHLSSTAVGILIQWYMPEFFNVNDSSIGILAASDFWLTAVSVVLLVPITEEVMYRGLLFGCLYRRSKWAAYFVSALVFSAVHVVGYIGQYSPVQLLLCLLQYIPASLCLGWAYAHTGNLFAPVLIHTIINAIGNAAMR